LQSVSPKHEKHVDDHLEISSLLAFSEQQDALIAAQNQVTQRVIDNNQQLRKAVLQEYNRAEHFKQCFEDQQKKTNQVLLENQALRVRIAELEARPTIHADQLVGVQNVAQQNVRNQLVVGTPRKRGKNKILDLPNQLKLDLWPNTTTSL